MYQCTNHSPVLQTARSFKTELQRGTRQLKDGVEQKTKERWQGKRMPGQFPCNWDEKLVDNEQSYHWLKFEDIKGETEGMIVVAQGQRASKTIVKIKFWRKKLTVNAAYVNNMKKSIDHLTSRCLILAKNEYVMRHYKVFAHQIDRHLVHTHADT